MSASKRLDWQAVRERLERARLAVESDQPAPQELAEIYRRRAAVLAQPLESQTASDLEAIMIFGLGAGKYAVPLSAVTEVVLPPKIAVAPGAPTEIAGLIQVRGEIRVLWDLQRLLKLSSPSERQETGVAILLRTSSGEAGLLVHSIEDIQNVDRAAREAPPPDSVHAAWMTHDLVVVLDVERLWMDETGAER